MEKEQWQYRIGYLGPEASFTHVAANALYSNELLVPYPTISDCMDAVEQQEVDFAVVPIENALEGTVAITLDYLYHDVQLKVEHEILSPIAQHLLCHPANEKDFLQATSILSHSHAIAQCHKYLASRFRGVPHEISASTAAAAKHISQHPSQNSLAIANEFAAKKYGLTIVERNIHDFHLNHTRFFVLSKTPSTNRLEEPKTTWMILLPEDERSGALHQVLSVFAWRKLNLSKIESRPLKTGIGHYFFVIDLLEHESHPMMFGALEELKMLGCEVKSLGSYHVTKINP
ncbi:prephenate dehydratase [Paenisporosarcina cavernae]|uniref:Prephenate dehydratase n=1 Tax=Paenisporosarcina cavernae TaxID=2320858 RepID=A0A385YSU2_9BACL|nr:prephenate dehydratase [Paenisporosarcina cavernae]AYC29736.1 prephenate dehydratase [Paenisporosarcina cavernae]